MKTDLKEINSYKRQLDVTVEWDSIESEYQKEFNQARLKYNIPGFRKGKVPEKIVKKNLGPAIEANFAENSLNDYYRKALQELEITPINQATINNLNFQEGLDLSFTAQFEVEPVIQLPNYQKKIKIRAIRYMAENEDIEQALSQYQEQNANIKTIETGAKSGHFIRGDFQILEADGQPKKGSKLENQYIRMGFGLFKDDKEKVFLGAKAGDEVDVSIPGKEREVSYQVTVHRVEEQVLPELDDELAKTINENANNLDDLKLIIKEQIQASLDKDHQDAVRKEIINHFVLNVKLDAPESMINRYLDHIKEDLENRKQPFNEDELKENYKSQAEWNIKWYLLKDKLLSIEGLDMTDAELDGKISEMISANKEDEKQIKSFYRQADNRKRMFDEMLNDKLFEKLTEYASIKVVEQSTNELRKQQANK
jgi:trigger factor